MIWAIASALGIGGIGAALWLIPGALPAVITLLRTVNPLVLAIVALAASTALLWHNGAGWRAKAETCGKGRAADRASYVAAQVEATRIATEAKRATEAKQEAARKEADDKLETARSDASRRLAEWMRRQAVGGPQRRADLPGTTETAQVDHGAGSDAYVVGTADLEICTENTVRLQNARKWALGGLIE